MSKISFIFSLCVLIFILSCKNFEAGSNSENLVEVKEKYYPNGNVERRYYMLNGVMRDSLTEYYESGTLKSVMLFDENGIQHGKSQFYYENGSVREVQLYDNGKRLGGDSIFYENGSIKAITNYVNGKRHGFFRQWNLDGELVYQATYVEDEIKSVDLNKLMEQ